MTRDQVADQALSATTLEEIEQARQALRAWKAEHPQERILYECFEQLAMMEEAAHFMAAEKARMTEAEWAAWTTRRNVYSAAYSPRTLAQAAEAERGLHLWLCEHPGDEEMRGLYPALVMYRETYEILTEDDAATENAARHGAGAPELAAR